MNKVVRSFILLAATGIFFLFAMRLIFVWSGAQTILADPERQSKKFLDAFMQEPLPAMAGNATIVWKGFFIVGCCMAAAFLIVNNGMKGGWLRRGVRFGLINWLLMVPWFEFYLPYNVMLEPLPLVLFEAVLWFGVLQLTALFMSFAMNWSAKGR